MIKITKPKDLKIITSEEVIKEKSIDWIRKIEDVLVDCEIKEGRVSFIVKEINTDDKDFKRIYNYISKEYKNVGWKDIFIKNNDYTYTDGYGSMEMQLKQIAAKVTLIIK